MKEAAASTPPAPSEEVPDQQLVEKVRQGDEKAYDELMSRYEGKVYAMLYNMTGNAEDARDLTQEAFVKAYRAIDRFQGRSSFYTWVYRIAVNRGINFVKKRKRRVLISMDDDESGVERSEELMELAGRESPLRDLAIEELQEKLNRALATLSDKHRTVVVLHDIEGIPHDEIAAQLGCSSGTVRSRLFYARRQLQAELSDVMK